MGEKNPAYAEALIGLAGFYQRAGLPEKEERTLRQMLDIERGAVGESSTYRIYLNLLARHYIRTGNFEQLLPVMEQTLQLTRADVATRDPEYVSLVLSYLPELIENGVSLHALVIGNSSYVAGHLRQPVNNAEAIADALEESGFRVTRKTDVTQADLDHSVTGFARALPERSLSLFYFAGHGVESDGKNYLVPVNVRIGTERYVIGQSVDLSRTITTYDNSASSLKLFVLDVNGDSPFERMWRRPLAERGLAAMEDLPSGVLVASANSNFSTSTRPVSNFSANFAQAVSTGLLNRESQPLLDYFAAIDGIDMSKVEPTASPSTKGWSVPASDQSFPTPQSSTRFESSLTGEAIRTPAISPVADPSFRVGTLPHSTVPTLNPGSSQASAAASRTPAITPVADPAFSGQTMTTRPVQSTVDRQPRSTGRRYVSGYDRYGRPVYSTTPVSRTPSRQTYDRYGRPIQQQSTTRQQPAQQKQQRRSWLFPFGNRTTEATPTPAPANNTARVPAQRQSPRQVAAERPRWGLGLWSRRE